MFFCLRAILKIKKQVLEREHSFERIDQRDYWDYRSGTVTNLTSAQKFKIQSQFDFVYRLHQKDVAVYLEHSEINCNIFNNFEHGSDQRVSGPRPRNFIDDKATNEIFKWGWTKFVRENKHYSLDNGPIDRR